MIELLTTYSGRISRAKVWLALLLYIVLGAAAAVVLMALWQVIPGEIGEDGEFHVEGVRALPYIAVGLGYVGFSIWSGLCVAIKRYHDRDKSGWWVLIQLVPVIGGIWYFIEVMCLRGTVGPNRFGPDPLA